MACHPHVPACCGRRGRCSVMGSFRLIRWLFWSILFEKGRVKHLSHIARVKRWNIGQKGFPSFTAAVPWFCGSMFRNSVGGSEGPMRIGQTSTGAILLIPQAGSDSPFALGTHRRTPRVLTDCSVCNRDCEQTRRGFQVGLWCLSSC